MYVPDEDGVPEIVIVLPTNEAETPVGNPVAVPIPVAPEVVWVIFEERAALIQTVGVDEGGVTVFIANTVNEAL